jgi:PAS domain S-box-containing protein
LGLVYLRKQNYLSENLETLFGLAPGTFDGRFETFINLVHPEDRELVQQAVMEAVRDKKDYELQFRVVLPNGNIRWAASKGRVFYDSADKPIRMIGLDTDITARKELEIALQVSETKLEDILSNTSASIFSFRVFPHRDWEYEYQSPSCEVIYGYRAEEILTDKFLWMSRVLPEDREKVLMPLFENFFAERTCCVEFRFQHKDGSIRWISGTYTSRRVAAASAQRDCTKDCWIVTGICLDISDAKHREAKRKQAEEALKVSEQRLQAIVDNSPAIIYLIDSQNRHLLVNRSYAQLLSTTPESLSGKSIYEVWSPEIADAFAANNQQVFQGNQAIEVEETAPGADGVHTYLTIKFPLHDVKNIPYAVCGISTNITERKLSEQKIREQATLIDVASDAIFVRDLDNRILFWNKGAERLYGWTTDEVLDQKAHELFYKESSFQL